MTIRVWSEVATDILVRGSTFSTTMFDTLLLLVLLSQLHPYLGSS